MSAILSLTPGSNAALYRWSAAEMEAFAAAFRDHGFAVLGPPALEPGLFAKLRREAQHQRQHASWPLNPREGRTTAPQDNRRGRLGPVTRGWLASGSTLALMRAVSGHEVAPSWAPSCFTYYDQPGNYLGRHCDQQELCALALLLGLESTWPSGEAPGKGNQLWVYQDDVARLPVCRITTMVNRIVILNGSKHSHGRPPVEEAQKVSVLSACFMMAR